MYNMQFKKTYLFSLKNAFESERQGNTDTNVQLANQKIA